MVSSVLVVVVSCLFLQTAAQPPFFTKTQKARKESVTRSAAASGGFDLSKSYSLDFLQRGLSGEDHFSLMNELLANKDLDTIFGEPSDALLILQNVPAFKMFKGVDQLLAAPEAFTSDHGLNILEIARTFVAKGVEVVSKLKSADGLTSLMKQYGDTEHPDLKPLYDKLKSGDQSAIFDLTEKLLQNELGDILDVGQIGMNGQEPDAILQMRQATVDNPLISRFLMEEELNLIKDPLLPLKQTMNVGADGVMSMDNVPGLNANNINAMATAANIVGQDMSGK